MKGRDDLSALNRASMDRRHFLTQPSAALAALSTTSAKAGEFTGKIQRTLKWSMAEKTAKAMPLVEAFKKLKQCGFDGVEPSVLFDHVKDPAEWVAASKESGLIIDGTVGGRLGALEKGLDTTKAIGGETMLIVVSYDIDKPLTEQWNRSRDELKTAAPYAEKCGVRIVIENVWNTFFTSPFDLARFVDEVGSPWVQVQFDIGNVVRWGVPQHWMEVLGKRSLKLDIKEYDLEVAMTQGMRKGFDKPLGEGSIDWAAVRAELTKMNYTGWAAAEVKAGDWTYLADVAARMAKVLDL
jgi:L-ribulose-5-phosphate 3-epimerase